MSLGRGEPLPGGYRVGEKVFFTGASQTFPSGNKLVHGQQGEVAGPATLETHKGKGVAVLFPGNKGNVECYLVVVSRAAPPPLPGGYKPGEKVFYTGASWTVASGDKVVHGQQGEVVGPAVSESSKGKGVKVLFPGNKASINCLLTQLSGEAPPPLPGGYKPGEKVFYTGASWTVPNGDKLVHGQQGEVVGPATLERHKGKGVAVLFSGNKDRVGVPLFLTELNRAAPPALPSTSADEEEVAIVGERTFAQRDAECRKRAIDLEAETPRKRGRGAAAALEERVVSARSVCTAAVDKRVRELAQPAFDEYMADRIDAAELDRRKAAAREQATAEHAQLTELERASAEYTEAVSARTTAEAAEDAAVAKLEAVLRGLERGQPGPSAA